MGQLSLDFSAPETAESGRALSMEERFELWLKANRHIYEAFKETARQARDAGFKHYGAKGICEYLRFHSMLHSEGDAYKINNVFISRMARKLIEEDASFSEFFEVRELKSK